MTRTFRPNCLKKWRKRIATARTRGFITYKEYHQSTIWRENLIGEASGLDNNFLELCFDEECNCDAENYEDTDAPDDRLQELSVEFTILLWECVEGNNPSDGNFDKILVGIGKVEERLMEIALQYYGD
jgi:hypothetical protein